jgi:hypothetical protein
MSSKENHVAAIDLSIDRAGGVIKFARAMGVTHQAVYGWRKRGWVPPERAVVIEAVFRIDRRRLMKPSLVAALYAAAADPLNSNMGGQAA